MATISDTLYDHCYQTMRGYIVNQCRQEFKTIIDEFRSKPTTEVYETISNMKDEQICEAVQCHTSYTEKDFAEWVVSIYSINYQHYWIDYEDSIRRSIWEDIAERVAHSCMNPVFE